jgi:3-mercaptopyruvate sulfurtransferase SseA
MLRRTLLLSLVALGLLVSTACSKSANLKTLTVEEVAARLAANDGKTFVFDNNPKDRYLKSHVPGAKWLDYDAVTAADLPGDKGATLIFYCASEL